MKDRAPLVVSSAASARADGFVLPFLLVVLTLLTGLVVAQMRRAAADERLAGNVRETVLLDNAVQTTLRWCESHVIDRPGATPRVAGTADAPAWRIAANWGAATSLRFTGTALAPGLTDDPACIVEDATCDLQPPVSPTGASSEGCNGIDARWRKWRLTARVRVAAPDLPGGVAEALAQSELRVFVD